MDCGPTCLKMVAKFYGLDLNIEEIKKTSHYGRQGLSMLGLADTAELIGFKTLGTKLTFDQLKSESPKPSILLWDQNHYVVLIRISKSNRITIADPSIGVIDLSRTEFLEHWGGGSNTTQEVGIALLIEATENLEKKAYVSKSESKVTWISLLRLISNEKRVVMNVIVSIVISGVLQLIPPFLAQNIIDIGVNTKDISFIGLLLIGQFVIIFSQLILELLRSSLLLYLGSRVNLGLLTKFWKKLLRLPLSVFESKNTGDIIQRINDHKRLESFITETSLSAVYSIVAIAFSSILLLMYSPLSFFILIISSILYYGWIAIFQKMRRRLDFENFYISAKESNSTWQLVNGINEIKLNNAEKTFQWDWENIQANLIKIQFKLLKIKQIQQIGSAFINHGKNIIITFIVAKLVVDGRLSIGVMLSIQYILGQISSPIEHMVSFAQSLQEARISTERINNIHLFEDEEPVGNDLLKNIPMNASLYLRNISFNYPGSGDIPVLKNVSFEIPFGKVTAIVGMSGSGKSTLVKLLLKIHETYSGHIFLDTINFKSVSPVSWRENISAVLQDTHMFNTTIKNNIVLNKSELDTELLRTACTNANLDEFLSFLPLGLETKIGVEGVGISGGQKQRIAIARAIYKSPQFVFLDEATNSLDSKNEYEIISNIERHFKGCTIVIIAHRLSTIRNADQIVVLDKGEVLEQGGHSYLIERKGKYYELVSKQLENIV